MHTILLPFSCHSLTILSLFSNHSLTKLRLRRGRSHLAVAGCSIPFPYHSLIIPVPLAYHIENKMCGEPCGSYSQHQHVAKMARWPFWFPEIVPYRTSVGRPFTSPHCLLADSYEFFRANHIWGRQPANIFCKLKSNRRKDHCRKCRRPRRSWWLLTIPSPFSYHSLTIRLPT